MGVKISDVAAKGSSDGTEILAVSNGGVAGSITAENIKDYTKAAIEAIAAVGVVDGNDEVMIIDNTDGLLHPVDIDVVAQHAIDTIWAKAKEASPDDADEMAIKDGGSTEKTILLSVLAEYVRATIEAAILDVSDLADGSGALADSDYMLVTQGSTGKQVTFEDIKDGIHDGFTTYLAGLDAVASTNDTDLLYVTQSGTEKKIALSDIIDHFTSTAVTGPGSTTEDNIPQWTDTNDDLKDGLTLSTGTFDEGLATAVATTAAIRDELDRHISYSSDIGVAIADADTILIDDGDVGQTKKSTFTRIWTWILAKLVAVADVTTIGSADGSGWVVDEDTMSSDSATKLCTQQSIKAYVDSGGWDGSITDIDLDGGADISADLEDADLILVDDNAAGANKKSEMSRVWTYIQEKIEYDTIWVPASDMVAATTDPATASTYDSGSQDNTIETFLFTGTPASQDDNVEFTLTMPEAWDAGTIKAKVYWTNETGASPSDYVEFYLAARAFGDSAALDTALGTAVDMEDMVITDNDLHITDASSALTIAGSPAAGTMVHFRLSRDFDHAGAGVPMTEQARVFGVLIQYKKDAVPTIW